MGMVTSSAQVRKLLEIAKEFQVASLKVDGFEVVFPTTPKTYEWQTVDPKVFADPLITPATEDEVKFYSAPGGSGAVNTDGTDFVMPFVGDPDSD